MWGNMVTALGGLDISIKVRLNPTELAAAGAIVRAMRHRGYSEENVNLTCRAMVSDPSALSPLPSYCQLYASAVPVQHKGGPNRHVEAGL